MHGCNLSFVYLNLRVFRVLDLLQLLHVVDMASHMERWHEKKWQLHGTCATSGVGRGTSKPVFVTGTCLTAYVGTSRLPLSGTSTKYTDIFIPFLFCPFPYAAEHAHVVWCHVVSHQKCLFCTSVRLRLRSSDRLST